MIFLRHILQHPLTRDLDLDSPAAPLIHHQIIQGKPFLQAIYREWRARLLAELSIGSSPILEIGAGAGFRIESEDASISSDLVFIPTLDLVCDAQRLPLAGGSLAGIFGMNILHHLPAPKMFFSSIQNALQLDGILALIEPWHTPWSQWVYTHLHHEPYDPTTLDWQQPYGGPLSSANGALPWIIFDRDRSVFAGLFPQLQIESIQPLMPWAYLLSGGVSMRSLLPGWAFPLIRWTEKRLEPRQAMFALIILRKIIA
jgi:SAM-dependent methyltransferase